MPKKVRDNWKVKLIDEYRMVTACPTCGHEYTYTRRDGGPIVRAPGKSTPKPKKG